MKKYNIPFSPPDISEEEISEVVDTLKSGWITTGPKTKTFEKEIANYCHTEYAVCLNSATAALQVWYVMSEQNLSWWIRQKILMRWIMLNWKMR